MASVVNPEPFRERFDLLLTVIESLKQVKDHSDKAAQVVTDADEIDLASINLVVDAWLTVLEDGLIREEFEERADKPVGDATIHWVTTEVLQRVQSLVGEIDGALTTLKRMPSANAWVVLLAEELKAVLSIAATFRSDQGEIHRRQLSHAASLLRQVESEKNLRRIEASASQALTRAEASADLASEAAGSTGESMMGQHYQDLATNESDTARQFRFWTIISTIFGGMTAGIFVLGPTLGWDEVNVESGDWVHLVQRSIVTAAVFAFSAYLARQAHQHRAMANWAGSLAVQLQTFEAFLAPIKSEDVRDQLRTSFATRVFGDHPAIKGEPSETRTAAVAEKALDIIAKNSGK